MEKESEQSKILKVWENKYSIMLVQNHPEMRQPHHGPLPEKEVHLFGDFQHFDAKRVGPFIVIKNVTYALKKGGAIIGLAQQRKSLTLKVEEDGHLDFKGWPQQQIIVYIDLTNRRLIWPGEGNATNCYIIIKTFQFCEGHSLLIIDADKVMPQILDQQHMISSLLIVSGMLPNYTFGYNSQGAGSTYNYFHYQLFKTSSLATEGHYGFQQIKGTSLKSFILDGQQNKKVEVTISYFEFIGQIFVRVNCQQLPLSHPSIINETTKIIFKVFQMAFEIIQPNNLNIPNPHNLYIIFRTFAVPQRRPGWIECSGVYKTATQKDFDQVDIQTIQADFQKSALNQGQQEQIITKLMHLYK